MLRLRELDDLPPKSQDEYEYASLTYQSPGEPFCQDESSFHCSPEVSICDFSLDGSATLGTQLPYTSASLSSLPLPPPISSAFPSVCSCGVLNEFGLIWSPTGRTIWEGLRGIALLKGGGQPFDVFSLPSAFRSRCELTAVPRTLPLVCHHKSSDTISPIKMHSSISCPGCSVFHRDRKVSKTAPTGNSQREDRLDRSDSSQLGATLKQRK